VEAAIRDCVSDAEWLVYDKDGGLVNDAPGGSHRTKATVKKVGGVWKVTVLLTEETGTC
jgi:hypothetical protein